MSRDKGIRAQHWVARYLTKWWPLAEAVGSGRRGTDILNTPGIDWEVKTAAEFKPGGFVRQAAAFAGENLPVVIYIPHGCGEQSIANTLAILPLHKLMGVLEDGGYTPGASAELADALAAGQLGGHGGPK